MTRQGDRGCVHERLTPNLWRCSKTLNRALVGTVVKGTRAPRGQKPTLQIGGENEKKNQNQATTSLCVRDVSKNQA